MHVKSDKLYYCRMRRIKEKIMGRFKWLLFAAALFFSCPIAFAGDITFHFCKESSDDNEAGMVYGFMYVKAAPDPADNCVYLHVTAPVNQIVEYKGNSTTIYYPDDNKAIIFESDRKAPKINPMDPAAKKLNLGDMGMVLVNTSKTEGGTTEIWAPKNITASPIKNITLMKAGDGTLRMININDKSGKLVSKTQYSDFKKINGIEMPLDIETYSAAGGPSFEAVKLSKPDDKSRLPEIIAKFAVPPKTDIETVKF
jgi:hypothetical protein